MSNNYQKNMINNESELLNYLGAENIVSNNSSIEQINHLKENYQINSNSNINYKYQNKNNNQNKGEILDIEYKNVQMLILQRSLYILKNNNQINKKELEIIYQKYKDEEYMRLKCINIDYLLELYQEIMDTTQFTMLPYINFNELISADLMTEINESKSKTVLKALVKFTQNNIEKYNRIYFDKKMRKKQLIEENEKKQKSEQSAPDLEDYTSQQKIVKINKRGKILHTFEEMIENNKEFEVGEDIIAKINEDDMSILNNKKLLYSDVIPLIIADFLQEYLKNKESIAIVSTSNVSEDPENYKLNQNVRSLFDNDILKFYNNLNKVDQNQENKEKLKNLLFELMNIENQIKIYQKLILENTAKGANVKHLMNMEKKLNEQKIILQKKINQFSLMPNNNKSTIGGDISVINDTNSNFGNLNSLDKIQSIDNKMIKRNNSNSKSNKSIKTSKNIKYKIGTDSSNMQKEKNKNLNNKNNDINGANSSKVYANSNNSNLISINGEKESNLYNNNNLNNDGNNKFNYYYNNENFYYQHGVQNPETKEEFRKNSLLEIFYFYTKQHSFLGQTPTFQEILKSEEHLDMAEFGKFCVEFKILVKPHKIAEIFKKTATNSKELNYALFVKTLQKLSVCANDEKKQYLMERIKIYKMKLKEIKEKNKNSGNVENENDQNKSKEKEENLSGIKSEGEAEDEDKCQQEKNMENQKQEENKNIENENTNDKKSKNEKDSDKKSNKSSNNNDKKSNKSNIKENLEKVIENKDENLLNSFDKNEDNENKKENEQNLNNENQNIKEQPKINNNNKNNISTNLKYYRQNKAKYGAKNKKQSKKLKLIKPKTNSFLMMETKEELEEKISKLQEDYDKLNQKTSSQLEEEFYQYLEIDDINSYRKKMVGYIYPFINRENASRFPLQSVARPVKRDPKMQKEMHKILQQRHEEMKREKELKQIKEKNILFEKRKKQFEVENKKIQQKMSLKNDYIQFKRKEEDYLKEKMNKLTWEQIQNCDYDTFIINEKDKADKYKNNLDDIFTSKSNQFEGDDGDYLKNFRLKRGINENIKTSANKNNNNKINININNISNSNNNLNIYESINKTEALAPKFDTNLSRISSGNNAGNNSDYDIVNSIESNK